MLFIYFGFTESESWRLAMVIPGVLMMVMGFVYYFFTRDTPEGDFRELEEDGKRIGKFSQGSFLTACRDRRVWALFIIYGACFGVELTLNNIAALYFMDYFHLSLKAAGLVAGLFGLLNLFARSLGGFLSDRVGIKTGLRGRVLFLGVTLLLEGVTLMLFSKMTFLPLAITALLVFSLFVKMAQGATYSIVPFLHKRASGSVAGIVGAGGNVGAVLAACLLISAHLSWPTALFILGGIVILTASLSLVIRFSEAAETEAREELEAGLEEAAA